MKLVTVAEMQQIEREADAGGLTYDQMMQNAGKGLAERAGVIYGLLLNRTVLGLVGSGNNGGDTLVALAALADQGWKPTAYLVRPRPASDPLLKGLKERGGAVWKAEDDPGSQRLADLIQEHAILLDGVLGTGVKLPLKSGLAQVLDAARRAVSEAKAQPHVIAVDCPSGVNCDSGEAGPECIPAELTVTMAAVKTGLVSFPAYNLVGNLEVVGIGPLDDFPAWKSIQRFVVDEDSVRRILPERLPDSHKGTFGTLVAVAGSVNYTGAAFLAGKAAYRVGTGLVTLALPAPLHATLAGHFPEATWILLPNELGVIAEGAAQVLRNNLERATALLVGPGVGMEETTKNFIDRLIGSSSLARKAGMGFVRNLQIETSKEPGELPPLVFDADGLKLLSRLPDWAKRLPAPAILTPHPGEMAILTGLAVKEIQADRLGTAERYAREWGHVVVLKGALSIIAAPDGRTALIPVATPALARAGTGDVLAGIVAGLRAQGVEAFAAAYAGAWIHAQAGLKAAETLGNTASVLAGDVLTAVVDVMNQVVI